VRAWLHQHRDEIYEVDEIRALIERHIVQGMNVWECVRAADRAAGIIVRQEEALATGDAFSAARLDSEFHMLLCSHTDNRMLRDLAYSLIEQMPSAGLAVYSLGDAAARSLEWHRAIVRALERGDGTAAADLDFRHTQEAGRYLRDADGPREALPGPSGIA
jgi:DNA-binding GntR family transcriptional regulator